MDTHKITVWVTFLFLIFFPWTASAENKITNIELQKQKDVIRILFKGEFEKQPRIFFLSNPDRFVADFVNTKIATNVNKINIKNKGIRQIRVGFPKAGIERIVFDLQAGMIITKNSKTSHLITIDLSSKTKVSIALTKVKNYFQKPTKKPPKHITIVIDPGHGGKDPGAVGVGGVREKDVVLGIGQELARLINREPYMHAVLTRTGDYYVPLYDRMKVARKHKADLYVAIHADSYFNKKASGVSIYALSEHGATSLAAKWLATRENHSELNNVSLGQLDDQSYLLRSVLIDLAQTATVRDSLRLGNSLLSALENVTNLHYKRVEQAPFMVLKFPDIPSLLVETGFISNVKEERRLRDKAYQHKIALALFKGIHQYHTKFG